MSPPAVGSFEELLAYLDLQGYDWERAAGARRAVASFPRLQSSNAASAPGQHLERKIHFFRADVGRDDAAMPLPFAHEPVLRDVDRLSWTKRERYFTLPDGAETACWVEDARDGRLVFGNIRRSGLPQLEEAGTLADLRLAANQSLNDAIHVRFFPENIVGCDFNFYGPRMSRLGTYLIDKVPMRCPQIQFQRLLRQDMVARLDSLDGLRLFRLRIVRSAIEAVEQADKSLADAFRAQAALGESDELEILIKVESYARGRRIDERFHAVSRRLLKLSGLTYIAKVFHVSGREILTRGKPLTSTC